MLTSARRVVVTGLGVFSPIGSTVDEFWTALQSGAPGVRRITEFDPAELPCHIGGVVLDFDARQVVPRDARKSLKAMARTVQLGVCAAQRAMEDGGPSPGQVEPIRFGVNFGCVMISTELDDLAPAAMASVVHCNSQNRTAVDIGRWGSCGQTAVPPLWMLKYLPNMPASHVSVAHNARGPNNTITSGDAASLLAVGEAFRGIQRSAVDFFLAGGCDSQLNPLSIARRSLFDELTSRNDEPATAVRPFDATRDGTAPGEGAAVLGLESLDHALTRGAKIYAEVIGFASGFCRDDSGTILSAVIRNALADARVAPDQVDHINAHAGGLLVGDAVEARAIHSVFGSTVPVYALKGQIGNLGAAAGATELIASVLALNHGELPGTVNYTTSDPACPISIHSRPARATSRRVAVKISRTESGQCAAIVIRRWS